MKVAITGGIGSGKSTFIQQLERILTEYSFYNVDQLVRRFYDEGEFKQTLINKFGTSDRREISDIVFQDKAKLHWLEQLFLPHLELNVAAWCQIKNVVVEVPMLFEMGLEQYFDFVIGVVADDEVRFQRVKARNGFSEIKIRSIMDRQFDQNDLRAEADEIVDTTKGLTHTAAERVAMLIRNQNRGIVAGSFDPITEGHIWLIERALNLVDVVDIVIAHNPMKKGGLFDIKERENLVRQSLKDSFIQDDCYRINVLPQNKMLVAYAEETGAEFIFRGIRNVTDFDYEAQINLVNKKIAPNVETVFLMPPSHLTEVSSSVVKGMLHLEGWENAVRAYVPEAVLEALKLHERERNRPVFLE